MAIKNNYPLKSFHTFGTDVYAGYFTEINSVAEFKELQKEAIKTIVEDFWYTLYNM